LLSYALTPFDVRAAVPTGVEVWGMSLVERAVVCSFPAEVFGEFTARSSVPVRVEV